MVQLKELHEWKQVLTKVRWRVRPIGMHIGKQLFLSSASDVQLNAFKSRARLPAVLYVNAGVLFVDRTQGVYMKCLGLC